jgi:Tol biopolymer transport system component
MKERCHHSLLAFGLFTTLALFLLTTGFPRAAMGKEEGQQTRRGLRIAYVKDGNIWTMNPDGTDKKQITSMKERVYSLSYSRAANRIWFIKACTSGTRWIPDGDVFSARIDGTDLKQVTSGLEASLVAVSPDGEKIGVRVRTGQKSKSTLDVWIMDANGKAQTASTPHADVSGDLPANCLGVREGPEYCSWSPNSRKILLTYRSDSNGSLGVATRDLYLANTDGSNRQKIATGLDQPVFSPNGKYLAARFGYHWDMIGLKSITTTGADYKEVLAAPEPGDGLYSAKDPCWQGETDGRVVYSVTNHTPWNTNQAGDHMTGLYACTLSDLKKTAIVRESQVGSHPNKPQSQPSGTKIVFQVGGSDGLARPENTSIWIVDIDGTGLKQLTSGPDDREPIWIGQ